MGRVSDEVSRIKNGETEPKNKKGYKISCSRIKTGETEPKNKKGIQDITYVKPRTRSENALRETEKIDPSDRLMGRRRWNDGETAPKTETL